MLGMQPWQSNEVAGLLFGVRQPRRCAAPHASRPLQCFLLGSFLGAFKADGLIARGQARHVCASRAIQG